MLHMLRTMRHAAALGAVVVTTIAGQAVLWGFQSQGGFVKVPDELLARQETLPAAPLVFTAYGFVWSAVLVYVFFLWRRIARVDRELAQVTQTLRERADRRA